MSPKLTPIQAFNADHELLKVVPTDPARRSSELSSAATPRSWTYWTTERESRAMTA